MVMSESSAEPAARTVLPTPKHASPRKRIVSLIAAVVFGVTAVVGIVQLERMPGYEGPAALIVALLAAILAGTLARPDVSIRVFLRLLWLSLGGACVATAGYAIAAQLTSETPPAPLPSISATGTSNSNVGALGIASFTASVASGYGQLTVSFSAANSAGAYPDNCVNGSQEDITPSFGAVDGPVEDIPTGMADIIRIPHGITVFRIIVQFVPQQNYTSCNEDILVSSATLSR
jgi:hypothetical protein